MQASAQTMWHLIKQSDAMTMTVLLVLLGMSIFSWVIFFYKMLLWRVKKRQLTQMAGLMKHSSTLDDVLAMATQHNDTLPGLYILRILSSLKLALEKKNAGHQLTDRDWSFFEYTVGQTTDEFLIKESKIVPVVGACMTISPLLGLFGTVWGLVISFMDISRHQSADITAVAPGIAMALITTIAGLLVAIPAAFIFYYLQLQLKSIESKLVTIGDRTLFITQRFF